MFTAHEWYDILVACQVKPTVAAPWSEVFANCVRENTFSAGKSELDDFLGQVLHESGGLVHMVENLDYSIGALMRAWPSRFPTREAASHYAHQPEKLANYVYGGRMGNVAPGDGWTYRGRAPIQITGLTNYLAIGKIIGQDLDVNPELLEQPRYALEATIAWWEDRIPDSMLGDTERITRRVNGGILGLAYRQTLTDAANGAIV